MCQLCKPYLSITHGCRGISVYGAEVSLAVNKGIAHGKILGHPDDGIIYGRVSMGMVFTYDITHDTGRFLVRLVVVIL